MLHLLRQSRFFQNDATVRCLSQEAKEAEGSWCGKTVRKVPKMSTLGAGVAGLTITRSVVPCNHPWLSGNHPWFKRRTIRDVPTNAWVVGGATLGGLALVPVVRTPPPLTPLGKCFFVGLGVVAGGHIGGWIDDYITKYV